MKNNLRWSILSRPAVLGVSLILGAIAGCGDGSLPIAEAEGKVTLNGQPVTEGSVTFISDERGSVYTAPLDSSGQFKFEEPVEVGSYTVTVNPPQPETPPETPEDMKKAAQMSQSGVPEGYHNEAISDLKAEVKQGQANSFTFELNPAGPAGAQREMQAP